MADGDTIWIATSDTGTRKGIRPAEVKVEVLTENVNLFLGQLNNVLEHAPETVGKFQFVEFEVSAEISAKGQLVLLGAGGEAGVTGGLKFVFKRVEVPSKKAAQPAKE